MKVNGIEIQVGQKWECPSGFIVEIVCIKNDGKTDLISGYVKTSHRFVIMEGPEDFVRLLPPSESPEWTFVDYRGANLPPIGELVQSQDGYTVYWDGNGWKDAIGYDMLGVIAWKPMSK
jgi:hypothetical protein